MTLVAAPVLALLAELERTTSEIINRHWDADDKTASPSLKHHDFFEIRVHTGDGLLARFMEEGVDLYPVVEK